MNPLIYCLKLWKIRKRKKRSLLSSERRKTKTTLSTLHSVWGFWAPPGALAAFPLFLYNVTLTLSRTILSFPLHGCCGLVFDFKFIQHSFSKILMSMLSHQFTKHLLKICCAMSIWAPGSLCGSPHCPEDSSLPPRWGLREQKLAMVMSWALFVQWMKACCAAAHGTCHL